MSAPAPPTPRVFRDILIREGCEVVGETEANWVLSTSVDERPLVTVPKKGSVVPLGVMMEIMNQLKINNGSFFKHKREIESE